MKKHFILSLMAAVLMALNVNAQEENTYSMVITLANGTSITIGPNEVSNISFNDGEVTVSGAKIEEMVENTAKNSKMIMNNSAMIERNKEMIDKNSAYIEKLEIEKLGREYYYELRELVDINMYNLQGEAKIVDSSGNYLTHYGYNSETGSWGQVPWTIRDITIDYMSREETMSYIIQLENRIANLIDQLRDLGLEVYF
jgi:hypothetical protein